MRQMTTSKSVVLAAIISLLLQAGEYVIIVIDLGVKTTVAISYSCILSCAAV